MHFQTERISLFNTLKKEAVIIQIPSMVQLFAFFRLRNFFMCISLKFTRWTKYQVYSRSKVSIFLWKNIYFLINIHVVLSKIILLKNDTLVTTLFEICIAFLHKQHFFQSCSFYFLNRRKSSSFHLSSGLSCFGNTKKSYVTNPVSMVGEAWLSCHS